MVPADRLPWNISEFKPCCRHFKSCCTACVNVVWSLPVVSEVLSCLIFYAAFCCVDLGKTTPCWLNSGQACQDTTINQTEQVHCNKQYIRKSAGLFIIINKLICKGRHCELVDLNNFLIVMSSTFSLNKLSVLQCCSMLVNRIPMQLVPSSQLTSKVVSASSISGL